MCKIRKKKIIASKFRCDPGNELQKKKKNKNNQ